MKKLVFMFVAFAAISFASCGNNNQQPAPEVDTVAVEEDTTVVDSVDTVAVDSAAAQAD